jgi:hypothetical protein
MRRFACLAAGASLALIPATARANGRFPAANQLVSHPTDASRMVLRATFGFLLTRDGGAQWDWVCERSVGYGGTEDPAIGVHADGTILAGLFDGLAVSRDGACSWNKAPGPLAQKVFIDVAVRRSNARVGVALASTFKGQTDAGASLFDNLVFTTSDDGATWTTVGQPLAADILAETIDFAESDPNRLYVSGNRERGTTSEGVLLVSTDGGANWTERVVPLEASERAPFIAAVDPVDAGRVYVRTSGNSANRLLVTEDAGQTFRAVFATDGPLLGFALSPDGSKVYAGSQKGGLHMAPKASLAFAKKSDVQVQCLMTSGTSLWACSNMISGFIVGRSEDDGATFAPKLKLDGIRGPLACPAGTSTSACESGWPALRDQLGGGAGTTDAGAAGDGGGGNAKPPPADKSGCSCGSASTMTAGAGAGLAAAIGALALAARRRSRRRG